MTKKYLFVGMAVILGASLSFFACESATDGTAGAAGEPGAPGFGFVSGLVSVDGLQAVIDGAVDSGATVYLDNVELQAAGTVDFKTVKAQIIGDFETAAGGGTVINAAKATVTFADGAKIAGQSGDVIIGSTTAFPAANVTGALVAAPAEGGELPDVLPVGNVTAIENLTLTATAGDVIAGLTVYVYGKLTVTETSAAPTGTVKAIGTVEVSGTNAVALAGSTVDITEATLTNTAAANVTLPAAAAVKAVDASAALTLAGAATSLEVTGKFKNTGATTVSAAGTTTFGGAADFGGAASFAGAVEFEDKTGFGSTVTFSDTATLGEASFGGDVTVTDGKAITLTSGKAVSLVKDKSIIIADTSPVTVLTAATDVALTPAGAATLTPALSGKSLTLAVAGLELTSGTLTVAAEAELALGSVLTVGAGAELAVAGDVTVATTGGLTLTAAETTGGAKISGAGKVALGFANITGGTGGWQAVGTGASIAFAVTSDTAVSITGTGTSPVLAGVTDDSALITLAKGHTDGDGVALTVSNATIDLTAKGGVAFPHVASTAVTLVLKGGGTSAGALKLGAGTTDNSNTNLTSGGQAVTITGSGIVQGDSNNAGAVAGRISGGATTGTNDVTITGKTSSNDVTVKAGATLAN